MGWLTNGPTSEPSNNNDTKGGSHATGGTSGGSHAKGGTSTHTNRRPYHRASSMALAKGNNDPIKGYRQRP